MAEYDDLAQINTLNMELIQVDQALKILDEFNGTVTSFSVSPRPVVADPTNGNMPAIYPPMPVTIINIDPSQEMLDTIYASLTQRHSDLIQELTALGITNNPPARSRR